MWIQTALSNSRNALSFHPLAQPNAFRRRDERQQSRLFARQNFSPPTTLWKERRYCSRKSTMCFHGVSRFLLPYARMGESSMRAELRGSREIPPTPIAGDTCIFGESGIAHKRRDRMLGGMRGAVPGANVSGTWNNNASLLSLHFLIMPNSEDGTTQPIVVISRCGCGVPLWDFC
jgi:hypothetical protein